MSFLTARDLYPLSCLDDVCNLIQSILEPLADAEAWKQHALLKCLEECLIGDRVMTDIAAINRVRYMYLAFTEKSVIPANLEVGFVVSGPAMSPLTAFVVV
jgi:hypothetical protein